MCTRELAELQMMARVFELDKRDNLLLILDVEELFYFIPERERWKSRIMDRK